MQFLKSLIESNSALIRHSETVDKEYKRMKAIQFTSLRLGATYEGWPEDGARIRQKQRDLLAELFKMAQDTESSLLISTGDLFDAPEVPLDEVEHVLNLCKKYPGVTLAALPGGCDPWGAYTVYNHLQAAEHSNLFVLSPKSNHAREVLPGVWLYAIPADGLSPSPVALKDVSRLSGNGIHIAVAYGSMGRLKEGPEEGLVMVTPDVAAHEFDWLALADGESSEKIGSPDKPATYAGPLISDGPRPRDSGSVWSIRFGGEVPEIEAVRMQGIRHAELKFDVSEFASTAALAAEVRREADSSALMCLVLSGVRPADRPIAGLSLNARCARDFLAFRVVDDSTMGPPSPNFASSPAVSTLWKRYQDASDSDRQAWSDALNLYASGITEPHEWKEAPWAL